MSLLEKLDLEPQNESMLKHLEELRKRIIFSCLVLASISIASYFFTDQIISFLVRPISSTAQKVYFMSPYGAFLVKLQLSLWSGVFLSSPLILSQIWFFIAPGLYDKEKKIFLPFLLVSIALFLFGLSVAMFAVIPATINFFLSFSTSELAPLISINQYLSFYLWTSFLFGLAFEAPIFLVGLVKFQIVRWETLRSLRRQIVVGIFIFSAIVTPTPDPFSQCFLAFPLWLLFELSIAFARFFKGK